MIVKTLPFPVDEMNTVKEQGALVDMSKPQFPGNMDKFRTTLIYLRNTGFTNIDLNFSSCSTEDKFNYLLAYFNNDINVKNKEFVNTWIDVLLSNTDDLQGFLTKEEIELFIKENSDLVNEIKRFAVSIPLYIMDRFKHEGIYSMDEFKPYETDKIKCNINNIIRHPEFILIADDTIEPVFYTKQFTHDNNKLFDAAQSLLYFPVLNALATDEQNICKQILECTEDE